MPSAASLHQQAFEGGSFLLGDDVPEKFDVYQHITNLFIASLEKGTVPWRRTWTTAMPRSLRQRYRGINQLMLMLIAAEREYQSPLWLTWGDIQKLGGKVTKGSQTALVTYFKMLEKEKDGKVEKIPMLRFYRVFNADVVEGIPVGGSTETVTDDHQEANVIAKGYRNGPRIVHRPSASPVYRPSIDTLELPPAGQFNDAPAYWQAYFHESTHSTGHSSRLNRWGDEGYNHAFGSPDYSREELVAELGSAFLMHKAGLQTNQTHENSTAYLASWLKVLKGDNKLVYQAASKAQKAVDYICGVEPADSTIT